jgi:hypothetical protein
MELFLLILAAFTAAICVFLCVDVLRGIARIPVLGPGDGTDAEASNADAESPAIGDDAWPRVSIVVAARNEERDMAEALTSLLAQVYPDYEVNLVDDRSTDATGEIADRIASGNSRLRVVHVTELPPGWLGKNHALQRGADAATGEIILFTDADVVMHPTMLRRSVAYMVEHGIDHLAIAPRVVMPNLLLESFVITFTFVFLAYFRPWKASDPKSRSFIGIGAFNMVRAEVYRAVGGHEPLALRPDDDVKFGKLVKKSGYRQQFANAPELMSVRWYASLRELIGGLMKNAFSGVEYNVLLTVCSTIVALAMNVWPYAAVFVTSGVTRWLNVATVLALSVAYLAAARNCRLRPWGVALFPVSMLLFIYIQWRAMLLTYIQGGVRWRGTLYPLAELKANKL